MSHGTSPSPQNWDCTSCLAAPWLEHSCCCGEAHPCLQSEPPLSPRLLEGKSPTFSCWRAKAQLVIASNKLVLSQSSVLQLYIILRRCMADREIKLLGLPASPVAYSSMFLHFCIASLGYDFRTLGRTVCYRLKTTNIHGLASRHIPIGES